MEDDKFALSLDAIAALCRELGDGGVLIGESANETLRPNKKWLKKWEKERAEYLASTASAPEASQSE